MKPWEAIRDAWEPFLGSEIAEERARNAAAALLSHEEPSDEATRETLSRAFTMASLPIYGGVKLSGSTVMDAVHAAEEALQGVDSSL
jgi:hypothetical protein